MVRGHDLVRGEGHSRDEAGSRTILWSLEAQLAAVLPQDAPSEVQPEAEAGDATVAVRGAPVEAVEESRPVLGWDTRTPVPEAAGRQRLDRRKS